MLRASQLLTPSARRDSLGGRRAPPRRAGAASSARIILQVNPKGTVGRSAALRGRPRKAVKSMSESEIENAVVEVAQDAQTESPAEFEASEAGKEGPQEADSAAETSADEPDSKPTTEPVAGTQEAADPPAESGAEPTADAVAETQAEAEPATEQGPEAGSTTADDSDAASVPDAEAATAEQPEKPKRRGRRRTKLDDLVVGTETKGKVVGLAKFGCFVDIGAVTDGLVHVTEFPSKRVRNISDEVQSGDEVYVWIKDVDTKTNRISLSMRKKPQRSIRELSSGDVLSGTVTSVTKYGAFIDISSDTEGLVHISEMSSGYVEQPSEIVSSGDAVEVRIKEIDLERQRISLSMVGLANDIGLEAQHPGAGRDDSDDVPEEPEERMPTVVELALRRALGTCRTSRMTKGKRMRFVPQPMPATRPLRPSPER